jgi:hypothetical protein
MRINAVREEWLGKVLDFRWYRFETDYRRPFVRE